MEPIPEDPCSVILRHKIKTHPTGGTVPVFLSVPPTLDILEKKCLKIVWLLKERHFLIHEW